MLEKQVKVPNQVLDVKGVKLNHLEQKDFVDIMIDSLLDNIKRSLNTYDAKQSKTCNEQQVIKEERMMAAS